MTTDARRTMYPWPSRRKSARHFAGLICAMLVLHLSVFLLFRAATPAIKPPPRTAPPVQLLTSLGPDGQTSEKHQSLLRWIQAEDPALVGRIPNVDLSTSIEVPYKPSFAIMRTAPLGIPPEPATVQFPPARDAMSIILSAEPRRKAPREILRPQSTRVHLSTVLAERAPTSIAFKPATQVRHLIEPAAFLVGVTAEGETRFVFSQGAQTGTVPALDREAAQFVASLRFAPRSGTQIVWGTATIFWGDELIPAPAK